jgi:glycerophosphoryl diester phosphodiesterase
MLPLLIGHRGIPEFAPENSISGAILAKQLKIDCIEVDAMLCRDNVAIIHHDTSLKRCSGIEGTIKDYDYHELMKFSICANHHVKDMCVDENIPRMRDMIVKCKSIKLLLNIEIKCEEDDLFAANVICKEIKKYGHPSQVIISSYDINVLKFAKQILPEFERNYIVDDIPSNWHDTMIELECSSIIVSYKDNSFQSITDLLKFGYRVYVFTINDIQTYRKFNALGIGVFSDKPYTLSKYL